MERFFIERPVFAIALAVATLLLGAISIGSLSIEQYPDITPPVVEVTATYPGADAETVNDAVATPIAQSVMGVSDMLYLQTTSANDGSMSMQVTFDIGSDPDMDAIFTQNNVASATSQLPEAVVRQGVVTRKTMTGFLMVYALHSDGRYDDEFLSNYAYINLQNELLKIDGVGKVSIMGAGEYAMRIWLRPDVLDYYDLSVAEISSAIATQAGIYPAGKFGAEPAPEGTAFTYTVRLPAQISTPEEFGDIVIKTTPEGSIVRLHDVAEVALGSETYGSTSSFGGEPTTVIVVYQSPGSNAVEVGSRVKSAMMTLSERFPDGIEATAIVDTTTSIDAGIEDIFKTLIIALVLVILIIYLFLQDWRATLIPLIAIPVSLVGTFIFFPLLGFSINIISLLGLVLAIGLVVDDAIVVVEAVQVNIERGVSPRKAAIEAMRNVASPIVATTVVLLAVFIPVSFISGISGLLFRQFSVTIAVAVVLSAFNALTLSPALSAMLLKRRERPVKGFFAAFNRLFDRGMKCYGQATGTIMRHSVRTLIFVGASMAAVAIVWQALPSGFLPEEDQGYVMVFVEAPEAASLQRTKALMAQVDGIVGSFEGVESTATVAGFNMLAGIASSNCGVIFVELKNYSERTMSAMEIADALTGELYSRVSGGECFAFIPPAIPGLGVREGITLEVQDLEGRGTAYLATQTYRLIDSLKSLPEIASVTTQFNADVPQRKIEINRLKALEYGVSLSDLYSELSTLLGGSYINNFSRFGRLYQTYLQAAPDYRANRHSLDGYFITNDAGKSIPVSSFVEVVDTVGVEYVSQYNLYRSIELNATPASKTSTGKAMQIIEQTAKRVLPDNVAIAWSGVSFQQSEASQSGFVVYIVALAFVFLALASLYNSWGLPLAILLSVPIAILGALLSAWAMHLVDAKYVNDIYMQISLVMLIGLAAKNAILVVEYADRNFFERGMSLAESALGAAKMRVRPILMTAFAFVLGVMPLVFADGVYATARNIMGVALVGGMALATLLGIFLYPALYYAVARIGKFEHKRENQRAYEAESEV